ncbi:CIS tube protein [Massilia antarctica]|uniref:CIS tube protein n=1 Tax=Massilia antarctica TaxID=2765360 RepID=UPI001E53223D
MPAIIEVDAKDRGPSLPAVIPVQFNPPEYTIGKAAQIAEIAIPGIDAPILQFVRGQTRTLALELFFDTTRLGSGALRVADVRALTDPVAQLGRIQPKTHAPPRITFIWGLGLAFRAIVDNVQQKFTLFNPAGIPVRATLTVSFKEYKTLEEQLKELNLQSADHSKLRVVRQRDTLARIAFEEYGDAGMWRLIADQNRAQLTDLRRLQPGMQLAIPAVTELGGVKGPRQ